MHPADLEYATANFGGGDEQRIWKPELDHRSHSFSNCKLQIRFVNFEN